MAFVPNWKNRTLFHGDNLEFLRAMNSESVDLIATDPPFNKSKDFHATPDSLAKGAKFQDRWNWEKDVHQDWVDQLTDDYPKLIEAIESARYAHSDGMGAYLCFMAVRLLEMRRLLKPTGSIYLHCDPTASHYLKAAMDAIFGWRNFQNQVIWCYGSGGASKRHYSRKHDIVLFYTRSRKGHIFNVDAVREPYSSPHKSMTPKIVGSIRYQKMHPLGRIPFDWWQIPILTNSAKERTGYPTQKPLALYERIIKASSNKGDIVFDPFAGCATTCVAAERLERQWVGIDIWDDAHEVVINRLKKEVGLFGEVHYTKELPERTDDKQPAVPFLPPQYKKAKEPPGPKMSRAKIYEILLSQKGPKCEGCDRVFDDPRYLQLDHNTPRSDGGINHISNRILLCGPCNQLKSNIYTLSGLRRENKKRGYMAIPLYESTN